MIFSVHELPRDFTTFDFIPGIPSPFNFGLAIFRNNQDKKMEGHFIHDQVHSGLVPDDTVQIVTNCLPFGTWGSLNLDIAIAIYLITDFFLSFLYFTLNFLRGRGSSGRGWDSRPQRLETATTGHGRRTIISTLGVYAKNYVYANRLYGRDYGKFSRGHQLCFNLQIHHGGDHLHLAPPPPQIRPACPMGINLWTYNIQDGCGFGIPQAIQAVERGNYDLMLLTDTNITDAVYFHNCLVYGVVCSRASFTTSGVSQGGGRNCVAGESRTTISTPNNNLQRISSTSSSALTSNTPTILPPVGK